MPSVLPVSVPSPSGTLRNQADWLADECRLPAHGTAQKGFLSRGLAAGGA